MSLLTERHGIVSNGLIDQARNFRMSECGRALYTNHRRITLIKPSLHVRELSDNCSASARAFGYNSE